MSSSGRRARRLAVFLATAGTSHLLVPGFYDAMIPPRLPGRPRTWTYGSGLAELATAALVGVPRTRRLGGATAAALFVVVFPGNVQMLLDARRAGRPRLERAILLARLPVQAPLIAWALKVRATAG